MISYCRFTYNLSGRQIEQIIASIYILIIAIFISGIWSPITEEQALVCLNPPLPNENISFSQPFNCFINYTWSWALTIASITIVIGTSALVILGNNEAIKLREKALDRKRKELAEEGFYD